MVDRGPTLVACQDTAAYEAAVRILGARVAKERVVPYLAGPTFRRLGFPANAAFQSGDELLGSSGSVTPYGDAVDDNRVCIALETPLVAAAARLLADALRKRLVLVSADAAAWENAVRAILAAAPLSSLTFVLPAWEDRTRRASSVWIERLLALIRELHAVTARLSWGVVSAADPTLLTAMVAKTILQSEIVGRYRDASTGIFVDVDNAGVDAAFPRMNATSGDARLERIDRSHFENGSARLAIQRPWNLMIFKGHGRTYCASEGYLCGARDLAEDPCAPLRSCVLGMQCGNPRYAQVDPRSFDAPVVVMDCCGAGGWASEIWEAGIPSVSFIATGGAAGAVITSDSVTMNRNGDTTDVLWALTGGATMGEATERLNSLRYGAAALLPYYLLGDPDIVAGRDRWPDWFVEAERQDAQADGSVVVRAPASAAPIVSVRLPYHLNTRAETVYVESRSRPSAVLGQMIFVRDGLADVWVGIANGSGEVPLRIGRARTPRIESDVLQVAIAARSRTMNWGPALAAASKRFGEAAERVVKLNQVLERNEGIAAGNEEDYGAIPVTALALWLGAHSECVEDVLALAHGGLWPYRLWNVGGFRARHDSAPCPACGTRPTLRRSYEAYPALHREQWECLRCDLLSDWPSVASVAPTVRMSVAPSLSAGEATVVELELDNATGKERWLGAGAIVVDGTRHGIISEPRTFPVEVAAGGSFRASTTLAARDHGAIAHIYRARTLLLLNGLWFLASRHLALKL